MTAREGRLRAANRVLSAAVLALCLAGAGGMFWVGQQLADIQGRMHPPPQEEQRRLQARLRIDAEVEEELGRLADDIGADRTLVYLAHNGSTDLTGRIPFMFVSNVYAHLRPGVAWSEAWSRPQPLSIFSPTLRRIFKDPDRPACVSRDLRDPDLLPRARASVQDRGVESWIVCPLFGQGGTAGFLLAEWMRRDARRGDAAAVEGRAHDAAVVIHGQMTSR